MNQTNKPSIWSWTFFRGVLARVVITLCLVVFLHLILRWSLVWAFTIGYFLESFGRGVWDIYLRPRRDAERTDKSS